MRQPNQSFPGYPRAVDVTFFRFYNRAALNVTSILPLTISLTHLLGIIPQWREPDRQLMTEDGGLEALIDIMSSVRTDDLEEINVRRLAMKCLAAFNYGQHEILRVRTVEARILPGLVSMLEVFWRVMETEIQENTVVARTVRKARRVTICARSPTGEFGGLEIRSPMGRYPWTRLILNHDMVETDPLRRFAGDWGTTMESDADRMDVQADDDNTDGELLRSPPPEEEPAFPFMTGQTHEQALPRPTVETMDIDDAYDTAVREESLHMFDHPSPRPPTVIPNDSFEPDIPNRTPRGVPPNAPLPEYAVPGRPIPASIHRPIPTIPTSRLSTLYTTPHQDLHVPRMEDIQECLDLLGTLSKYPQTRHFFTNVRLVPSLLHDWRTPEDIKKQVNIFEIVERFTFAEFHPAKICTLASAIMRNYQRKDSQHPRPCGNLHCKKIETEDKKFIPCSHCRYPRP
jgi:hypothetical protein